MKSMDSGQYRLCEWTLTFNAALLEVMLCLMVQVRVVEHGLGRDAANVQTCSTEGTTLLDTCRLQET